MLTRKCAVGALACALGAGSAQAAFDPTDSAFGANTLIYDSTTSITWLSTAASKGLSYNQVAERLDAGETFAGYRIATQSEVLSLMSELNIPALWTDAGFYGTSTPETLAGAREFIDLFGGLTFDNGSGSLRGGFDSGQAWYPESGSGGFAQLYYMSVSLGTDHVTFVDDNFGRWKPTEYADMGTFLVAVPEPSTYALMLVGLAAIALAGRRQTRGNDRPESTETRA